MPAEPNSTLDVAPLDALLGRIRSQLSPEQIWLFGSRARGQATASSDWDLLVVLGDDADDAALDPVAAWRIQRGAGVYADVVPCRRRDFEEDRSTPNSLPYVVAREGILLYER